MEILVGDDVCGKIVQYFGLKEEDLINGDVKDDDEKVVEMIEEVGVEEKKKNWLFNFFKEGEGEGDDFFFNFFVIKGVKMDNFFYLFSDSDIFVEKLVIKVFMFGDFVKVIEICLKEDRMVDVFLIVNCGG